jgi:cytochrome c biogenesis protein CcdA
MVFRVDALSIHDGHIRDNKFENVAHLRNKISFNSLNAELNPICHLLVLLGDLTFISPCIVSIFQYISNKMQSYTVYLYPETALHVSVGTSIHHQERIQLYLQNLVFVTPLLLSAAIVEELEPV